MATVSCHLKRPDATIPTAILALVTVRGKRCKVYSGWSILPKQWVKAEQRAQERGYQHNGTLNDALDLLQKSLSTRLGGRSGSLLDLGKNLAVATRLYD
jgi:hypothetical protein